MKMLFEEYGWPTGTPEEIARELSALLDLDFERRYSENRNGEFFRYRSEKIGEDERLLITVMLNAVPMRPGHYICGYATDCRVVSKVSQIGDTSRVEPAMQSMTVHRPVLMRRVLGDTEDSDFHVVQYEREDA